MPTAKSQTPGSKTRIQGVSTEQTVKATAGLLHRIVLSNGGSSARTLTLTDGATVQNVINLKASETVVLDIGARFATSIKATPSHAEVDALIIYD
ncbi:MAG TPA: hypothetical protein VF290_22170 [Pyrinomonadaceae bacterium]